MKFETKLDNNNTKLGLPQANEILEELDYMEFDSQNFQELGMLLDNMEDLNENHY